MKILQNLFTDGAGGHHMMQQCVSVDSGPKNGNPEGEQPPAVLPLGLVVGGSV